MLTLTMHQLSRVALAAIATSCFSAPSLAQSAKGGGSSGGVIAIDQAKADVGGVTDNDAPGFPVTISQSGSYRLASNLVVGNPNTTAVEITADNVTLDLNGFAILGATSCSGSPTACFPIGSGDGIRFAPSNRRANLTIINGTIRGMGGNGISGLSTSPGYSIDRVKVVSNGGWGIALPGATVTGSVVMHNGGHGIGGHSLQVSGNVVLNNGGGGLFLVKSGYGNNTMNGNNGGGVQVSATESYQTAGNICNGALCQ